VTKIVRPDFIFFAEQDGKIVADIIDPHGIHLADARCQIAGLGALCRNASRCCSGESKLVAEVGGKLRSTGFNAR
jgi:type III restriction enzyme